MQKFKVESQGIANVLVSPIAIFPAFPLDTETEDWPDPHETICVWDTGASHSVISKTVIDALSIKPTGQIQAHGVHEEKTVDTYLIHVGLPNRLLVPTISVSEGKMRGIDVLIGMDIINKGDFVVTNANGKTAFEFGMPAQGISLSKKLSSKFGKGIKVPRNLKVKIKHSESNQTKTGKYKDLEPFLETDEWFISEILN